MFQLGGFAHPIYSKDGDYPQVMKDRIANLSRAAGLSQSRLPSWTSEEIQYINGEVTWITEIWVSEDDHCKLECFLERRLLKEDRTLIEEAKESFSCKSKHTSRSHLVVECSILMKEAAGSSKPSVKSIIQNGTAEQNNILFTLLYFTICLTKHLKWTRTLQKLEIFVSDSHYLIAF